MQVASMSSIQPLSALPANLASRQRTLWCRSCAAEGKLIGGYCSRCYARRRWDRHYFAGLRAQVLARDGHSCQLCYQSASGKRSIVVHHRRPGVSKSHYLITLCPACHARLHRTHVWRLQPSGIPSQALLLWRELHPHSPEQMALPFGA